MYKTNVSYWNVEDYKSFFSTKKTVGRDENVLYTRSMNYGVSNYETTEKI